jgi:hypothetical protein
MRGNNKLGLLTALFESLNFKENKNGSPSNAMSTIRILTILLISNSRIYRYYFLLNCEPSEPNFKRRYFSNKPASYKEFLNKNIVSFP